MCRRDVQRKPALRYSCGSGAQKFAETEPLCCIPSRLCLDLILHLPPTNVSTLFQDNLKEAKCRLSGRSFEYKSETGVMEFRPLSRFPVRSSSDEIHYSVSRILVVFIITVIIITMMMMMI
jgi:hypothetical protein